MGHCQGSRDLLAWGLMWGVVTGERPLGQLSLLWPFGSPCCLQGQPCPLLGRLSVDTGSVGMTGFGEPWTPNVTVHNSSPTLLAPFLPHLRHMEVPRLGIK